MSYVTFPNGKRYEKLNKESDEYEPIETKDIKKYDVLLILDKKNKSIFVKAIATSDAYPYKNGDQGYGFEAVVF